MPDVTLDLALPAGTPPAPARPAEAVGLELLSPQVRGLVTRWRQLGGTAEAAEADGWDFAGSPVRWVPCRSVAVRAVMPQRVERGLVGWSHITRDREGFKSASAELWLRFAGWPARRGTIAEVRAYCDARLANRGATLEGLT